jgi:hypothetical protein
MASRPPTATEHGRRWLELWSEYEATRNEVIGVIENTSALGEEQARALLTMAKGRRAQAEEALVQFSHTVMNDQTRTAPIGSRSC